MQNVKQAQKQVPNEQLREERQQRGWSRAYIAEQIGVADPKTIGRWERGSAFPSAHFLQKLCELFQMPAAELGLWQRKPQSLFERSEAEVRRWNAGIVVQTNTEMALRAVPVHIGTSTVLLLIDDPWIYPEQSVDAISER